MDTGEWRRLDEPAAVADIDDADPSRPSRLASARRQWRRYATQHGRRAAVIGLGATFVLLLASEWMPWASVVPKTSDGVVNPGGAVNTFSSTGGPFDVGIDDANTLMTLTYHLMWVIVLALAGATVFASRRARQPLFGAAMGAIVVQFIAIVPLLRHPRGLIVNAVSDFAPNGNATELVVTRGAGMFCAVAALVVLAGAMVLAVEGNVLPSPADEDVQPSAGTDDPVPDLGDVEIEVLADESMDGRHSVPPATGDGREPAERPDVVAFTVEAVEGLPEHPAVVAPPPVTDYSAYARPLGKDRYRR